MINGFLTTFNAAATASATCDKAFEACTYDGKVDSCCEGYQTILIVIQFWKYIVFLMTAVVLVR